MQETCDNCEQLKAKLQAAVEALREIAQGRTEEAAFVADAALAKISETEQPASSGGSK